jgi:RNA 2',3'-cyclic 3'-phosphodiesterase
VSGERLFFAMWPGPASAAALAELARALAQAADGRAVPAEKIHLTLAFLGATPVERIASAREAARLRAAAVDGALDHVGSFRRAAVAWAGMSDPPAALRQLQAKLAARLAERGFALEERPFAPHVTLARRIRRPVARAPIESIAWEARELTLVRSETGTGRYTIMETWPLGA